MPALLVVVMTAPRVVAWFVGIENEEVDEPITMALMGPVEEGVLDGELDAATPDDNPPDDDPPAAVLDPAFGDVLVPD